MATLKLNDVTTMTESGGTVTMADGVALGTPSAVTLTNATFPTGHIIQTVTSNIQPGNFTLTANAMTKFDSGAKAQITNVLANSHVIVNFQFHLYMTRTSGTTTEANCGIGIHRLEGTFHATNNDAAIQGPGERDWVYHTQMGGSGATSATMAVWHNMTGIDTSPNTGTNTYYVTGFVSSNGNTTCYMYTTNPAVMITYCQEIAQ